MEGLIKLIFYLLIMVIWVVSNLKKQEKFNTIKKPPKPYVPDALTKSNLAAGDFGLEQFVQDYQIKDLPQREGDFLKDVQSDQSYEERLAVRRKKFNDLKQKSLKKISLTKAKTEQIQTKKTDFVLPEPSKLKEEKPIVKKTDSLSLKSNIKEGIIWSIILGPPRAKIKQYKQIPLIF
ncbi:MAG: hypothetical protein ABIG64_01730 [Candidatus Omnitrophota bacterium]